MKVNEVLSEGVFQDLATIGAQRNAEAGRNIGAGWSALKQRAGSAVSGSLGKIPGVGSMQQKAAQIKKLAQDTTTKTLANNITAAWNKELQRISAGQTAPMSPTEYQQRFSAWLEQMMHGSVAVDEKKPEFQRYITGANPDVTGYLSNYFIPAYQSLQTPEAPQIPNNTQVVVRGAAAGRTQVPPEIYTWNNGRWTDSKGAAITAGSNLHQALTADAINNLKAKRATAQTI